MIFMNSSSSRIIAIVSLLTLTSQLSSAAPTNRLTRDLAQECSAALQSDPVFVEVLQKTAALVVRNHRVPTNVELATALRTTEPLFLELLKKVGIPNVTELVRIAFQQFRSEAERSREHMLKLAGKFVGHRGRIPDCKHLSAITNTPRDQLEVVYGSFDNL